MTTWIKKILCSHNWIWVGNSVWKQNPMVVMFKGRYVCNKRGKQKTVYQNKP